MNSHCTATVPLNIVKLTAVAILTCLSFQSQAIVSMEDIHLGKPPDGFGGLFELGLDLQRGNTEETGVSSGLKLQWTQDKTTDFVLVNYDYGENAGVKNTNKGFAHYRHIQQVDSTLAWEGFTQFSFNEFTNLTLRALAGGGVRLALGEITNKRAFLLGLGAFYEHEELDTQFPDEADTEDTLRANTYLVIKYQFNAHVSFVSTTYFQPSLEHFSDFRAIEDLSVVSKLSDVLSLKVGFDIAHDSEPPRDVKMTDSTLKLGIGVNF